MNIRRVYTQPTISEFIETYNIHRPTDNKTNEEKKIFRSGIQITPTAHNRTM